MTEQLQPFVLEVFKVGLVSFGGLAAVLSELQTDCVHRLGVVTDDEFAHSYALAAAAPGPNSIFIALLGYQVAGPLGLIAAVGAWGLATLSLLVVIGKLGSTRWLKDFRKALVPCVLGLLVAGALATSQAFEVPVGQWLIAVLTVVALIKLPKVNPAWWVLLAGAIGFFTLAPLA
jgi:chromate transporter